MWISYIYLYIYVYIHNIYVYVYIYIYIYIYIKEVWCNKNLSMKLNLFKFFWVFHYREIWKIRFQNWRRPCYFPSSRSQKIKNISKTEHTRPFLFTFLVSFFMAFLSQKLICTINIWFNFVPGLFFEQDHLSNLIILGT